MTIRRVSRRITAQGGAHTAPLHGDRRKLNTPRPPVAARVHTHRPASHRGLRAVRAPPRGAGQLPGLLKPGPLPRAQSATQVWALPTQELRGAEREPRLPAGSQDGRRSPSGVPGTASGTGSHSLGSFSPHPHAGLLPRPSNRPAVSGLVTAPRGAPGQVLRSQAMASSAASTTSRPLPAVQAGPAPLRHRQREAAQVPPCSHDCHQGSFSA